MKRILKLILVLALVLMSSIPALADNTLSVSVNGQKISFETSPEIINGTTMVPMRSIFEAMGYQVLWDNDTQTITGILNQNIISLKVNHTTAYKNNIPSELAVAPLIKNSTTLIPLRFIAESAEADINWYDNTKTIEIFTKDFTSFNTMPTVSDPYESLKEVVVMINSEAGNKIHQGSGIIISNDGYIATNFHVIKNSTSISVIFNDKTRYTGEVTVAAYDTARDVAIIKINKTNLPSAILGDSDTVKAGDNVTAIGSPNGEFNQVTTGIVKDRNKYIISSSAFIKEGSSGGALFNSHGEVVGMTSSYNTAENYMAIPINFIKDMEMDKNIPLSQWKTIDSELVAPNEITYYIDNSAAVISWDSVYGADYYHIYSAYSENGNFTLAKNPVSLSYNWNWGFPYCFKITSSPGNVFYFKVSAVKDGIESPLSNAYRIAF